MPTLLFGHAPAGLCEGLAAQVEAHGFTLHQAPDAASIGGANGLTDFTTRKVSVRADMDDAARVKTLAHELGHVILHSPDTQGATDGAAIHSVLPPRTDDGRPKSDKRRVGKESVGT